MKAGKVCKWRGLCLAFLVLAAVLAVRPASSRAAEPAVQDAAGTEAVKPDTDAAVPDTDAAEPDTDAAKEKEQPGKWKKKNQKMYYVRSGKKLKGLQEIGGKTYYFDKKGVQHTGWQKISGDYYFFQISNGRGGFMVKGKKVDGVALKKNGKAKLTGSSKQKLKILVEANAVMEKATKPTMKKSVKLRKCFDYLIRKYKYRGSPRFKNSANWDIYYANRMFFEGHGECYGFGVAFAYLANAVGCDKVYAVSSGGHGWAEADGKVYDPERQISDKKHSYFGVSLSQSGKHSYMPNYKNARKYVKSI